MKPDEPSNFGPCSFRFLAETHYLEGQGDLVSRLIMGISRVSIWFIGAISLLTKSP